MKIYKQVEKKEVIDKLVETVCDICGLSTKENASTFEWGEGDSKGSEVHFTNTSTEIIMDRSTRFPGSESTSRSSVEFHICPSCFTHKLIPWMVLQGAKPTVKEWDI